MVSLGSLTASSIGDGQNFNWIFLIELLVSGILVLFFLFYFNRLFATLISYGVRAYTWHQYRVYIDIQALQLSFLAGRIFFKGVRYHGENETVFVQNGYLTWTYWSRSARQVDLARYQETESKGDKDEETLASSSSEPIAPADPDREAGSVKRAGNAQARITIHVSGLEWFIYNRTPVYEAILREGTAAADAKGQTGTAMSSGIDQQSISAKGLNKKGAVRGTEDLSTASENGTDLTDTKEEKWAPKLSEDKQEAESSKHRETTSTATSNQQQQETDPSSYYSLILRFLPVFIECQKGAILLGNETTRAILITTFDKARGHIDAGGAGPLDVFRQLFDFDIEHPVIQMRPNTDFRHSQLAAAEKVLFNSDFRRKKHNYFSFDFHLRRRRRKFLHGLQNLIPRFRKSVGSFHASSDDEKVDMATGEWQATEPESGHWLGLTRYLDDDERDDHGGWAHIDYARYSTILDCPSIHFNFYWDLPGEVQEPREGNRKESTFQDINQADPPAYGMELSIRGGQVTYGPWTDRLRAEIQTAFLPNSYRSVHPAAMLSPGSPRQSTRMLIRVEVEHEVTLRVPTKENSKDWQWRGRAHTLRQSPTQKKQRTRKHFRFRRGGKSNLGPDTRPFGWMDFSVAADSSVRYEMDLVPGRSGYRNKLELDLKSTKAASSVNHGLLWRCESQQLSCDLSNPLGWNSPHPWSFEIHNQAMEMFLLRDHMFLLIDLINDFTAGPKADYMTFVPFLYHIGITFADMKLYLNANDSNIIDNPSDLEDNTFLVLGFQNLKGTVDIPLLNFAPSQASVIFKGDGRNAYMDLSTPPWSTLNTFVSHDSVATLKDLKLDGAYNYCASISPQLTDSLVLDIEGGGLRLFLHGFLIRYFMNMKENYFGEDLHFRTLEEYQEIIASGVVPDIHRGASAKKENDLDVVLTVKASRCSALMPTNLYSRKKNVRFDLIQAEADMRFTNYYMDLDVRSSPIEASLETIAKEDVDLDDSVSGCQIFIDGATVCGHRLFGAPPTEPTYVCNWDIGVGDISGEFSASFLRSFIFAIQSFTFTLDDYENALPALHTDVIPDITFLRVYVGSVQLWLLIDGTAIVLKVPEAEVSFDDWAGKNFSKKLAVSVPEITVGAVDRKDAVRHHDQYEHRVETQAYIQTSLHMRMFNKKADFARARALQQHHLRFHDRRTHRANCFLLGQPRDETAMRHSEWASQPAAMPIPMIPQPALSSTSSHDHRHVSQAANLERELRRQHSFLSVSATSQRNKKPLQSGPLKSQDYRTANNRSRTQRAPSVVEVSGSHGVLNASPWAAPHFALINTELDASNLPPLPRLDNSKAQRRRRRANAEESEFPSMDDTSIAHTGFVVHLPQGLVGFCAPKLILAIASLVERLKPKHPVDQLDAVQIATLDKVMKLQTNVIPRETLDISIHIPVTSLRVLRMPDDHQQEQYKDQYDVVLNDTTVTCRIPPVPAETVDDRPIIEAKPLFHATAQVVIVNVLETSLSTGEIIASAQASVSDLAFWMGGDHMTKVMVQLRSVDFSVLGQRVEYMASLIRNTGTMVDTWIRAFEKLSQDNLLKHLVYHLTLLSEDLVDPIFLTRPSYVLRSAGQHLRLDDCWKIVSRLRHIYNSLSEQTQKNILKESFGQHFEVHEDAQQHVISSFDQWRNWDHDRIDNALIVEEIFGTSSMNIGGSSVQTPFEVTAAIGSTSIALESGPSRSTLVLGDTGFLVSSETSHVATDYEHLSQKLRVQSYVSQITLNLEWEIVELVGDTVRLFQDFKEAGNAVETKKADAKEPAPPLIDLFFVLGTDSAAIIVNTPNISLRLASEKLCGSTIFTTHRNGSQDVSATFAASMASAKVRSKTGTLMGWRVYLPTVYFSYAVSDEAGIANALRLAAACRQLRFDMKKEVTGILDVVHRILGKEVPEIQKLVAQIEETTPKNRVKGPGDPSPKLSTDAHLALFLDDYRLKFAILPDFSYIASGQVARTSIVPYRNSKLAVDFDLKSNSHSFRSKGDDDHHLTPALEVPPINGNVLVILGEKVTLLEVQTAIEETTFEAAAVRACVDALNRPDLARMIVDTKAGVKRLTAAIDMVAVNMPQSRPGRPSISDAVLAYSTHTTLGGFNIHFSAPTITEQSHRAEVDTMLGFTSLYLHNRTDQNNVIHEKPQFDLNIREIAIGIRRTSRVENTNFGKVALRIHVTGATEVNEDGEKVQKYHADTTGLDVDLYSETASLVVDVVAFIQERIKSFTLNEEARQFRPLRRLTSAGLDESVVPLVIHEASDEDDRSSHTLLDAVFSLEMSAILMRWLLYEEGSISRRRELEDLVFSIEKIDLKTKREASARLTITNLQLQMVPKSQDAIERSSNSALMPEVVFNAAHVSTKHDRRYAFQAAGKALDLQLASDFILPASMLQKSLAAASADVHKANEYWASTPAPSRKPSTKILGNKRLASLLVDADFAGAVVTIKPRAEPTRTSVFSMFKGDKRSRAGGRYGQVVQGDHAKEATLRAPGIALKVQYQDDGKEDPNLSAEFRVAASSNVLYPSVVPLILEITSSVKEIVGDDEPEEAPHDDTVTTQSYLSETAMASGDPHAILGNCKLNAGLWIQKQEFSLSCQPIARVAATAGFDDIFMTLNTVQPPDQDRFFALVATFNKLNASVQHVYSRESTASFEVDSIVISMMNSKHVSSKPGISAILNVSPMNTEINAKQLQDFLLFREIWYPPELRQASAPPAPVPSATDAHVQRYQQVVASGSFLWNAVVSVEELKVQVDLGQGIGQSIFVIEKLWASSKKSSDLEQNLCVGFTKIGIDSTGRMSGFVELQNFHLRTSIHWPQEDTESKKAPLVQGSIGFGQFRAKAAFDYQPFAVADISSFEFLMYNVRQLGEERDRLVGILDGDRVQVFVTTTSAAQGFAVFQAFERLIQEKQEAYQASITELDKYLRRKSVFPSATWTAAVGDNDEESDKVPFSLHTDVVVTLKEVSVGVFPTTFFDNQIFKAEATDAQARFAVATRSGETHSGLGMTLGQLRVALSNVSRGHTQALGEVSVPDVIQRAKASRGGTILKVPKLVMAMSTWQVMGSNTIEYTFKSVFEGKVDVGWNYSRISFIRGMWNAHSRALAQRLGKPITQSAVKITAEGPKDSEGQEKITAVVNVPQSKFDYVARSPPIIDTPQLRDLGEATPSVELFGLHRDRLPNVTHQIIVVPLLEVARKVEDAYSRILGSA